MKMVGFLVMLVMLLAPAVQGKKGGLFQAKNYNLWCSHGKSLQFNKGKISNDPGGERTEVGCCSKDFKMIVKDNVEICCPIKSGTAAVQCSGTRCTCVGGKGQTMALPGIKKITGTESGDLPAGAGSWPTQDFTVSQAKNVDVWCPKGYFITGHFTKIMNNVQTDKYAGKRITFGCCPKDEVMLYKGNAFMCCPRHNGKSASFSCDGNRCSCSGGGGHRMVAPDIKKKSEKVDCGSGSCYRKKDEVVDEEKALDEALDEALEALVEEGIDFSFL